MASAVEPKKKNNVMYAFICSILASMASIILGYDIRVMSGAALYIKKNFKITNVQLQILMGILNFYSLIGSFAVGRTSDWIEHRFTIVIAATFFFYRAFLMGLTGDYAALHCQRQHGLQADVREPLAALSIWGQRQRFDFVVVVAFQFGGCRFRDGRRCYGLRKKGEELSVLSLEEEMGGGVDSVLNRVDQG
ncbi:unnamed protein product [Urochloa humidicola]